MFWLIIGVLLFLLIRNQFDMQRTGKDVRRIVRAAGRAARSAVRAFRDSAQENRLKAKKRFPRQARKPLRRKKTGNCSKKWNGKRGPRPCWPAFRPSAFRKTTRSMIPRGNTRTPDRRAGRGIMLPGGPAGPGVRSVQRRRPRCCLSGSKFP